MKARIGAALLVSLLLLLSACARPEGDRPISIIAREDGSGTKAAFMEIIGLRGGRDPINVIIHPATAAVIAEVRGNPFALAYESLGYVTDDIKKLKVDGVEASVENIINGTYRIARPFALVYQEHSLSELGRAFLSFLQSYEAQRIIIEEGYVSLVEDAPPYTVNPALSGTLGLSGSTALQPLMIKLADEFESMQPGCIVNVSGGGSGTGYNNAEAGVSDFGMISEVFNPERAPSCVHHVIAMDGIAVIVNYSNPLDNITLEQLRSLYDFYNRDFVTFSQLMG